MSIPFDKRRELFKSSFNQAQPYEAFVATGEPAHQTRWRNYYESIALNEEQRDKLSKFTRRMNVMVLSGTWCGDCARQCPMLARIAESATTIDLRFIDNQAIPELRDEFRIHGADRVPVAVTLSEDFFEVGRYGDRTLTAYLRKARSELGDACETGIIQPPTFEVAAEVAEWVQEFERLHLMLRVSPMLRTRHND